VHIEEISRILFGSPDEVLGILRFGPDHVRHVGIVSGGAPFAVEEAIDRGLDLYITGDASHVVYHTCMEAGINVIFGGHYLTETWGVQGVAEKLQKDHGLTTTFIDVPTGL
jgi:putative NIF3 family GTP cyclohydrolase 1 type 2